LFSTCTKGGGKEEKKKRGGGKHPGERSLDLMLPFSSWTKGEKKGGKVRKKRGKGGRDRPVAWAWFGKRAKKGRAEGKKKKGMSN